MFTDPIKNLRSFGLKEDGIVVDLGAGTGFYAVRAGQMVPHGKVYAIEIVKDFLTTIKNKVKEAHLSNVECLWGDVEKVGGTNLKDEIADSVIASNIFFQVEDKNNFIEEIKRILRPNGRVLLIDWLKDEDTEAVVKLKGAVSKDRAREMFEKHGLSFERDIDTGAHHYGMILKKT